ncbi:MAG: hypothetical protein ACK5O1_06520 [Holosporales bacterium]|jgi:hypothetical protein
MSDDSVERYNVIADIKKAALENPKIAWAIEEVQEQIQREQEMEWCVSAEDPNNNNQDAVFECKLFINFPDVWQMFKYR